MPVAPTDWDAAGYDRVASFQEGWAQTVMERLPLREDDTVLDAGCGSGRATRHLLELVPRGTVIGADASPSMIAHARSTLGAGVPLITADLVELTPEMLREASGVDGVDAVFSNATFHWIADHELLFQRMHDLLRPGGAIAAQFGAKGNVAEFNRAILEAANEDPYAEHVGGWDGPWNFASVEDTERRLEVAGFAQVSCWYSEFVGDHEHPRAFMKASGFAPFLERLPAEMEDPFVDVVFDRMEQPITFRYVRLNVTARRPE